MGATVPADSVAKMIVRLGWPALTAHTVEDFQRGWALGTALDVDGIAGPKTIAALQASTARANAGQSTASKHFSFGEFTCECGGAYKDCRRIWVDRRLLKALDVLRDRFYPRGLTVASGCRCPRRNAMVGGAMYSQHLSGLAADIPYATSWSNVAALRLFSGIGRSASTGKVRHVDLRHLLGDANPTSGKPTAPTVWEYAS